jgi:hypothetical protein
MIPVAQATNRKGPDVYLVMEGHIYSCCKMGTHIKSKKDKPHVDWSGLDGFGNHLSFRFGARGTCDFVEID